jgi:hypothetical protein
MTKPYYLRFNTRCGETDSPLKWRLFDGTTHEETLIKSFEIRVPVYPVQTWDASPGGGAPAIEKWNIGFTGTLQHQPEDPLVITVVP